MFLLLNVDLNLLNILNAVRSDKPEVVVRKIGVVKGEGHSKLSFAITTLFSKSARLFLKLSCGLWYMVTDATNFKKRLPFVAYQSVG